MNNDKDEKWLKKKSIFNIFDKWDILHTSWNMLFEKTLLENICLNHNRCIKKNIHKASYTFLHAFISFL